MKLFATAKPDLFYQSTFTVADFIINFKPSELIKLGLNYNQSNVLTYFENNRTMSGAELCYKMNNTIDDFKNAYANTETNHPATYQDEIRVRNIKDQLPKIMDELRAQKLVSAELPQIDINAKYTLC